MGLLHDTLSPTLSFLLFLETSLKGSHGEFWVGDRAICICMKGKLQWHSSALILFSRLDNLSTFFSKKKELKKTHYDISVCIYSPFRWMTEQPRPFSETGPSVPGGLYMNSDLNVGSRFKVASKRPDFNWPYFHSLMALTHIGIRYSSPLTMLPFLWRLLLKESW